MKKNYVKICTGLVTDSYLKLANGREMTVEALLHRRGLGDEAIVLEHPYIVGTSLNINSTFVSVSVGDDYSAGKYELRSIEEMLGRNDRYISLVRWLFAEHVDGNGVLSYKRLDLMQMTQPLDEYDRESGLFTPNGHKLVVHPHRHGLRVMLQIPGKDDIDCPDVYFELRADGLHVLAHATELDEVGAELVIPAVADEFIQLVDHQ